MTDINKQKFLAELGRLLTFMYDEDRQTALTMYGKMFDDADNEQALLQFLVSPTRQAVVLARAYNAKERKLQVHAQPRSILEGEEPGVLPEFILAIDQIQQEAAELQSEGSPVLADQFTLFADNVHPQSGAAVSPAEKPAPADPAPAPAKPAPAPVQPPVSAPAEAPAQPPVSVPAEASAQAPEEKASLADQVEAFMEDFSIKDEALFAAPAEAPAPEAPAPAMAEPVTQRVPKTALLILYIILAIPVTFVGVALLLVPTLLFLALAGGAVIGGSVILSAAFSGFAVFADIMVVLGGALVVLAVGLLLLWTFVWFIGGAIVGFINAVIRLGGEWCFKEVQAA